MYETPDCWDVLADKIRDLVADQATWSQSTFGSDLERGPMGALKHLEKEARECQEAVGTPELREELADCLLLLLDASRRAGVEPTQLVEAAQAKMVKNKARTWNKPMPDEPIEHVREQQKQELRVVSQS